jgi:hydroxypyruvate isomerase
MLKFCANLSLLFTELPVLDRFQAARDAGFQAVEIQFPYDYPAAAVRQAADEAGVKIVLFNLPVADFMQGGNGLACVPAKTDEFKQALEHAMSYAELLKPECMNVLAGRIPAGVSAQDALQTYVGNLRLSAEAMAREGIKCVFEAINNIDMPGYPLNSIAQSRDILTAVDHPNLYLQFDIYHMTRMQEPLCESLRQMVERIGHIQFADVPGRGEPGSGQIDFAEVFTCIEALPYAGWLGAEYNPTTNTQQSLRWLVRS